MPLEASPLDRLCNVAVACRILDNLPVAIPQIRDDSGSNVKRYERGFPVGRTEVCILRVHHRSWFNWATMDAP